MPTGGDRKAGGDRDAEIKCENKTTSVTLTHTHTHTNYRREVLSPVTASHLVTEAWPLRRERLMCREDECRREPEVTEKNMLQTLQQTAIESRGEAARLRYYSSLLVGRRHVLANG